VSLDVTIVDVDAHLGHYPFRRLRHHTTAGLLGLMDRSGVSHSVVASNHALFYRDVHGANEELAEAVGASGGRLFGLATINPLYAGWEKDLEESIRTFGLTGLRLAPSYHGYRLTDDAGAAVLREAAGLNVPVALSQRIEDRRQRHPWDLATDLDFGDVTQIARAHPDLRLLLLNWSGINEAAIRKAGLHGSCLIDFARMPVVLQQTVPRLIDGIGIEAIAYGSHVPFNYPGPALVKLEVLELPGRDKERIAWRNAAEFLGLNVQPGRLPRPD
jgi:uncharacterized protein